MTLVHGHMLPRCDEDGCPNYMEQECQKCKRPRCDDHIAHCRQCRQLARYPELFCFSCAADHERAKSLRLSGNCIDEWMEIVSSVDGVDFDYLSPRDFAALQQRRIERYERKGIL